MVSKFADKNDTNSFHFRHIYVFINYLTKIIDAFIHFIQHGRNQRS